VAARTSAAGAIVIRGGRVYDHDGDVYKTTVADILIKGGEIVGASSHVKAMQADRPLAWNILIRCAIGPSMAIERAENLSVGISAATP